MGTRSDHQWRSRCRLAATLAVVVWLAVGARGASAGHTQDGNHCIDPLGVDVNAFYGVSHQIVLSFVVPGHNCTEVGAGEQWTVAPRWFMSPTFDAVPEGFVPAGATPLEDFVAKFVAVKYVVDPGTAQKQTHVFPNDGNLWTGISVDGLPLVNTLTLGPLHPLPVGDHVVEVYWIFSALHCDGLGAVLEENCIPAGETLFRRVSFQVVPGHNA